MDHSRRPFQNLNNVSPIDDVLSCSPQLRDYYMKYGKKRDLEQYFLSQAYTRRAPAPSDTCLRTLSPPLIMERQRQLSPSIEINEFPEAELRETPGAESSPSPRISFRSDTPALDVSPEQDLQDCTFNATSPGTLSASKKLEWDSLGDVGYDNARIGKEAQLTYRCGDGVEECKMSPAFAKELNYKVGNPAAHSTPNLEQSDEKIKSNEKSSKIPLGIHKKTSGTYNISYKSNRPSNLNVDVKKYYTFNIPTDNKTQYEEVQSFHFDTKVTSPEVKERQYHSAEEVKNLHKPIVQVSKTDNKEIQTVSRESTSASVQTIHPHASLIDENMNIKNRNVQLEEANSEDVNIDVTNTTRGSPNILSRAESFEYIPGSAYENVAPITVQERFANTNDVVSYDYGMVHDSNVHILSTKDISRIFDEFDSSQDLGVCLHKINKLLRAHGTNPSVNKKVVKKIVKVLMQTNYPSDNETPSPTPTTSSSSHSVHKSDDNSKDSKSSSKGTQKYEPDLDKFNNNVKKKSPPKERVEIINLVEEKKSPVFDYAQKVISIDKEPVIKKICKVPVSAKDDKSSPIVSPKYDESSPIVSLIDDKLSPIVSAKDDKSNPIVTHKDDKSSPVNSVKDEKSNRIVSAKDDKSSPIVSAKDNKSNPIVSAKDDKSSPIVFAKDDKSSPIVSAKDDKSSPIVSAKDDKSSSSVSARDGSTKRSIDEAISFKDPMTVEQDRTDKPAESFDNIKSYKHLQIDGVHSAPSTLTYSDYLKKKTENLASIPSTSCLSSRDHLEKHRHKDCKLKRKKNVNIDVDTERSSYRNVNISDEMDARGELLKINEEILKLNLLKVKLENQQKSDTPQSTGTDSSKPTEDLVRKVDKGACGDRSSPTQQGEPVVVYYNTVVSPNSECDYSTSVPPLDLAVSASSSSADEVVQIQCLKSSSRKCPHRYDESQKLSDRQMSECQSDKGNDQFATSTDSVPCDSDPLRQHSCCKSSTSISSCNSGLCPCCMCKIVCSQSSSTDSCTAELKKYQRIYDKYRKCKTMRSFVKEYDDLIKKYKIFKEKREAQSRVKSDEECPCDVPLDPSQCTKTTMDAMTGTSVDLKNVCCGSARVCVSKATSPCLTPGANKTNTDSSSSQISDRLVCQVRKAFAKEYEDITKRLENTKCNCDCNKNKQTVHSSVQFTSRTQDHSGKRSVNFQSEVVKSDGSDGPYPLSSQDCIISSGENCKCGRKDKCSCGVDIKTLYSTDRLVSTTASDERVKQKTACTCNVNVGDKSQQSSHTKECCCRWSKKNILSKTDCTSSSDFTNSKCKLDCTRSRTSTSNKEFEKTTDLQDFSSSSDANYSKQSVPPLDITESSSSPKTQTLKFSKSTYAREFQKLLESQCSDTTSRSTNRDCVKNCVCKKCIKRQYSSRSGETGGSTYQKCKVCSINPCKCVQKPVEKDKRCRCGKCGKDCIEESVSQDTKYSCRVKKDSSSSVKCPSTVQKCIVCSIDPCKCVLKPVKKDSRCRCGKNCFQESGKKSCCSKKESSAKCSCCGASKCLNKKSDNVVMCLWCKKVPMDSTCRICDCCLRRHQQYVENVIQRKKFICKSVPKSVAYNLIVESSESILEETYQNKPKELEKIFVKVAKIKNKRNEQKAIRVEECHGDEKGSTDEQIRDLSSLNSERHRDDDSRQDRQCRNADDRTLREFLEEHRPDFVCNTNCRQDILKKYNTVRRQRDAEQREILLKGVHSLPTINRATLDHLECIAREYGLFLPKSYIKNNFKVFDSKEMVKESKRKYHKLPEIENKRISKRKQDYKKTNLLLATIFSKKLQRKTLKGVVDISHSRQVISL